MNVHFRSLSLMLITLAWGCASDEDKSPTDGVSDQADTDGVDTDDGDTDDTDTNEDTDADSGVDTDDTDVVGDTGFPITYVGSDTFHVPSSAGGTSGIAVRITWPTVFDRRYPGGAPIVVRINDGWGFSDMPPDAPDLTGMRCGFVTVDFLFPDDEQDVWWSGGDQDWRGEDSIRAAADVARYALGLIDDADGLSITDRVPHAMTTNVGLLGYGTGGTLWTQALARHGDILPVHWLLAWETPASDQFAALEMNGNPYAGPCEIDPDGVTCDIGDIHDQLRFDPGAVNNTFDENGAIITVQGAFYLDSTGDGQYSPADNELLFDAIPGPDVNGETGLYVSMDLFNVIETYESEVMGIYDRPSWMANRAAVIDFWGTRDSSKAIAIASSKQEDVFVMHLQAATDHNQRTADHDSARQHVRAWIDAGHNWVRLNPDSAYLAQASGASPIVLPDNPAGSTLPAEDFDEWLVPDLIGGLPSKDAMVLGGIMELTDRARDNDVRTDLNSLLFSGTPSTCVP